MKIQPVILAGGNGYRVWPLSQKINPKQFVKYFDNLSSFQNTIIRNKHLGKPLVIANIIHKPIILAQLKEINFDARIIFEPEQKNTAVCAIIASYYGAQQGANTIILIPSDHHIEDQKNYERALLEASKATKKYQFTVIGIVPDSMNPNFGYIKTDKCLNSNLYLASEFIEKPSKELISTFVNDSRYFWNSGIYFFDIKHVLDLASKFIPSIPLILAGTFSESVCREEIIELKEDVYNSILESVSFDNAISVNLREMALIKAKFKWIDLGSWEAIWSIESKDDNQNNIRGTVTTHNVKNSYISSDAKQTLAINIKDTIVVLKNGQLLVAKKDGTELIKEMLSKFDKKS